MAIAIVQKGNMMIKLNLQGGETLEFNLEKEDDLNQWLEWSSVEEFQKRITGIGVLHNKKYHTLPAPKGFRRMTFNAELVWKTKKSVKKLVGEKVSCRVDNILVELLVYTYDNPPPPISTTLTLKKLKWKQRGPSFKEMKGKSR